jgi:mRNA interferase RelE/StbE
MAWQIEISRAARKSLRKIDPVAARRILRFLHDRIATADHPRVTGKPLEGSKLGNYWRYRVGHYRIIADLKDDVLTVLVVRIGHRSDIYH